MTASAQDRSVPELVAAGRDHVNHGSYVEADACYAEALERLDAEPSDGVTDRLRTRAHLGLAFAEVERSGHVSAALVHLAQAEAVLPADADDLRAALLGQRGILMIRSGRLEEALATFVSAEGVLARTTPSHRASMVLNRGLLHLELGHGDDARADFHRAIAEAAVADQPRTAYKARHNLACLAFLEGDLPTAIDGMASAPEHVDGSAEEADPITLMDRGRVLLEAGLVDEADRLLARAQDVFERQQRGRDLGEVALVRADAALVAGDLDRAAASAETAVTAFTLGGNDRWRRRAELVAVAVTHRRLSDIPDAASGGRPHAEPDDDRERRLQDLAAVAGTLADAAADDLEVAATARLVAVEILAATGDRDTAAVDLAGVVLPDPTSVRLRLRWHLARAAVARGGDLLDAVEDGVAELGAAQAQVGSRDLRTAMALHGRALVDRGIRAALDGGDPDVLHRAVDLAHAASARLTPVRSDLDDGDRALLAELRAIDTRLWRDPDADPGERAAWQGRSAALRARLRRRAWGRRGDDEAVADPVVAASAHRERLTSVGAVGVSYFGAGTDLFALRTDGAGAEVVALGPWAAVREVHERLRADLRVLHLPHLAEAMRSVVRSSLVEGLDRLDELVLRPLGVEGHDLVVVPHASLALVPWVLLPSRRGRATVATPSATRWVRSPGWGRPVDDARGPVVPQVRLLAGPDLARAGVEVADVAAAWDVAAPPGLATGADLRAALATGDVVHVAAHGTHRPESPLFSSVRLADGALFAHELLDRVRADVVVLSACDVGEQEMRPGDEPLGFAAALLEQGVDAVVGSVAPIRDDVAADVGRDLHRRLAAGASVAAATAAAAQRAFDDGAVAPVVVLGNGMTGVVPATHGG